MTSEKEAINNILRKINKLNIIQSIYKSDWEVVFYHL